MATYTCAHPIRVDGREYATGASVTLTDAAEIAQLRADGAIVTTAELQAARALEVSIAAHLAAIETARAQLRQYRLRGAMRDELLPARVAANGS